MASGHPGRLDEIKRALLDHNASSASALRQCLALGGAVARQMRKELDGYASGDHLPDYGQVGAALPMD